MTSSNAVGLSDWGFDERARARSSASESVSTSASDSESEESDAGAGSFFLLDDEGDSGLSVKSIRDGSLGVVEDFDF